MADFRDPMTDDGTPPTTSPHTHYCTCGRVDDCADTWCLLPPDAMCAACAIKVLPTLKPAKMPRFCGVCGEPTFERGGNIKCCFSSEHDPDDMGDFCMSCGESAVTNNGSPASLCRTCLGPDFRGEK